MYGVQRDGGWCEPLRQAARFRLGVPDDESERGSAQYSGQSWPKGNMGGNAGKVLVPIRDENFIFY